MVGDSSSSRSLKIERNLKMPNNSSLNDPSMKFPKPLTPQQGIRDLEKKQGLLY